MVLRYNKIGVKFVTQGGRDFDRIKTNNDNTVHTKQFMLHSA